MYGSNPDIYYKGVREVFTIPMVNKKIDIPDVYENNLNCLQTGISCKILFVN